ncbi:hypothetical protein BT63DRAFT_444041 [Microthyrium microscopicum]|uniref:Uncharacterized protein n=1 Tax=Microthyrium microscopicum TaxID=703497 RepID=A0A6A6TX15_9PEZI|nr:hypothetical protein BT63DRAFT_444041 [Microthyrium microscopicum]
MSKSKKMSSLATDDVTLRSSKRKRVADSYVEVDNLNDQNNIEGAHSDRKDDLTMEEMKKQMKEMKKMMKKMKEMEMLKKMMKEIFADTSDSEGLISDHEQKSKAKISAVARVRLAKTIKAKGKARRPRRDIFPFMLLPGEIRNQIYDWCLTNDREAAIEVQDPPNDHPERVRIEREYGNENTMPYKRFTLNALEPKILRLTKVIHKEAASILYSRCFIFGSAKAVVAFLAAIGPQHCLLLRQIVFGRGRNFDFKRSEIFAMFQLLTAYTNIASIKFNARFPLVYYERITFQNSRDSFFVKGFIQMIWDLSESWFRAMAVEQGNIFAGVTVFSIEQVFWEFVGPMAKMKGRSLTNAEISYAWSQRQTTGAQLQQCFNAGIKKFLRAKFSIYQADDNGHF